MMGSEIGNYDEQCVIGNGAYGTVYKAKDRITGEFVALKKVKVPQGEEGIPMSTLREVALLKSMSAFGHPHIIRLLDVCNGQQLQSERVLLMYLVFEYVDQDLAVYMERCPPPGLPAAKVKSIMYQLLDGIDFLHTNRLFHRDLKPQNILITKAGHVKIADFGLTRIFDMQSVLTQVVVTLWYRAPEVLLSSKYTSAVDLWACGCIFAEMIRNRPLFAGHTETDQLCRIFELLGTPIKQDWPTDVSIPWESFPKHEGSKIMKLLQAELEPSGLELVEEMLLFRPENRILAKEAMEHPYFGDLTSSPSRVDR